MNNVSQLTLICDPYSFLIRYAGYCQLLVYKPYNKCKLYTFRTAIHPCDINIRASSFKVALAQLKELGYAVRHIWHINNSLHSHDSSVSTSL